MLKGYGQCTKPLCVVSVESHGRLRVGMSWPAFAGFVSFNVA
jgi:hypothetical protein